jgi:hypothetical protein
MATGGLPDDGQLQLGSVVLPAGRQVRAGQWSGQPVAWVTRHPVPDAGRVWPALSDACPQACLVPVLLGDDPAEDEQGSAGLAFPDRPAPVKASAAPSASAIRGRGVVAGLTAR